MRNGRIMRHIARTHTLLPLVRPPTCARAIGKAFSPSTGRIVSTMKQLAFLFFFFVFFPRMKMTIYRVDISVITRWLHAKLLPHLAFNGRERKNCNNSESLSETDGSEN